MKRFEYKTIEIKPTKKTWTSPKFDIGEINNTLNGMSSQGWELVTMEGRNIGFGYTDCFYCIFKREL